MLAKAVETDKNQSNKKTVNNVNKYAVAQQSTKSSV